MEDAVTRRRRPGHLWLVGIVSLLWNSIGAIDYTMTKTRNMWYLKDMGGFTDAQIAYFDSFPAWAVGFWALGVWGALLGSLLLLLGNRHAVTAFAASLVGLAATTLYQFVLTTPPAEFTGAGFMAFNIFLWAVAIALLMYARAMQRSGVLR